jgi:hypothetical protein
MIVPIHVPVRVPSSPFTLRWHGVFLFRPKHQCFAANETSPGLWYYDEITTEGIAEIRDTVANYKATGEADMVIVFVHAGPNFEWQAQPDRCVQGCLPRVHVRVGF